MLEVSFDAGATLQQFPIRTLTVKTGATAVSITRVTDSKGVDISNGGTTTDTSVTVYGTVA